MEFVGGFFFILFSRCIRFLRFSVFLDLSLKMGSPKLNIGEGVPVITMTRNRNSHNSVFGFLFG